MRLLNRGQSEIIGGVIVLTALIITLGMVFTSFARYSSISTTGIAKRASFESERIAEKIEVTYKENTCLIQNIGSVKIKIVRIWKNSGSGIQPIDVNVELEPRSNPLSEIANIPIKDIYYIATSRGNVFQLKSLCKELSTPSNPPTPSQPASSQPPFTSEQIINNVRMVKGMKQGYLYAIIDRTDYSVVYRDGSMWYCSSKSNKAEYAKSISIDVDIDNNDINEMIINNSNSCFSSLNRIREYGREKGTDKINVSFIFKELLYIDNTAVDTITVYFKVIVNASIQGNPHQIAISPSVRLNFGNYVLTSPATITLSSSRNTLAIVFGSTVFPIKAFGLTNNIGKGTYDLMLILLIDGSKNKIDIYNVRLEYIAIVGASLSDPWN